MHGCMCQMGAPLHAGSSREGGTLSSALSSARVTPLATNLQHMHACMGAYVGRVHLRMRAAAGKEAPCRLPSRMGAQVLGCMGAL